MMPLPPRLQRMPLKLTKYDLDVRYVPGKQQVISDCLSRVSLSDTEPVSEPEDVIGVDLAEELGFESSTLKRFKETSSTGETSRVVKEYVLKGWPSEKEQVDELAREYWSFKEEPSVEDGLLFKLDRIVVPRPLRAEVLDKFHGAHMGESKSLSFARDYVFWPSMTAQIKGKVSSCSICNAFRNRQQRESLRPHDIPELPWQAVGTDLFEYAGQTYLLVTDFYSKYFEIELLRQNTATFVINNLKKIFASSPEYPQSNGAEESAVQTGKRILKKAAADHKDPFEGLLKYRYTLFEDIGMSPAQLLMSRRTRTMIPTHQLLLLPQAVDPDRVVKALQLRQSVSKGNYDKQSRDLPPLEAGDKVRIRPNRDREWRKAEVLPRSYLVQDEQRCVYRRNRRQIISVPNDHPMRPRLHDPPSGPQCGDSPISLSSPTIETPAPEPIESAKRPTGNAEHSPITTRSGWQVKKPQRLIESC
ncbi:hypothetical protein ACROYT_G011060 [Oculina patagonica]